ncbi:MAG TPA: Hsp70 family protein, partial [Pseudogracilibacillus sp.]|nr:Hsp70 family protein [Pseudogracilibacillus sp.]
ILCEGIRETYTITRDLFEELTQDLIERTWTLTESTLADADLSWRHVTDVLLVGGSTRMPMVHDYIEKTIGKPPLKGVDPDQAVALGATIKANLVEEGKAQKPSFSLASSRKVTDVMSHSLGMIAINKNNTRYINSIILRKNQSLPAERKRSYQLKTHRAANNSLDVYVTQGESNEPSECTVIGKYIVSEIPHQTDELAKVDVTYGYDSNGVIHVSAYDTIEKKNLLVEREDIDDNLQWLNEAPKEEEFLEEKVELSIVIAIDLSYSMVNEPIQEAQNATREFIDKMDLDHTSISLVGFADKAAAFIPLTNNREQLLAKVSTYEQYVLNSSLGVANAAEPFTEARTQLQGREGHKYILVLTDGLWRDQSEAIRRAQECHEADMEVIAIGFGGADEQFLNKIATTSENALFTNETELVSSFSKIAQELSDNNSLQMKKKSGFLNIFK